MKFGNNLKEIRKQRKISQEKLAEMVGVSRQSVSKWETGDAYPEMNNILQLCKIFDCHINDLVHENMSDIDSLDEEIKMNVVKLNENHQKKMKKISKALMFFSKFAKWVLIFTMIILLACIPLTSLLIGTVDLTDENLEINVDEEGQDSFNNFVSLTQENKPLAIGLGVILLVGLETYLYLMLKVANHANKLFTNIHDNQTPFTLENVEFMRKIAKCLIISLFVPIITNIILVLGGNIDLNIEFELKDVLIILVILGSSYIFEYGYQLQKESNSVMYDEEV